MNAQKEFAHAKINLYLNVLAKREDGFHDVLTVMHETTLSDVLTVSAEPSRRTQVSLSIAGNAFLPTDGKNLAVQAAALYLERIGKCADVKIRMEKNIPVAAGLAGGSADAAAVLRALNRIYRRPLTDAALADLSASLGSDVPYCVLGGTAVCSGRGEKMRPLRGIPAFDLVIAVAPGEFVSTPKAYAKLDSVYSDFDGSRPTGGGAAYEAFEAAVLSGEFPKEAFYNVFEAAVLPDHPGAAKIRERLLALGARVALMSGSGPSVFGIFPSAEAASAARSALIAEGYTAFCARSV